VTNELDDYKSVTNYVSFFDCYKNKIDYGFFGGLPIPTANCPSNPMPIMARFFNDQNDEHSHPRFKLAIVYCSEKPLKIKVVTFFEDQNTNVYIHYFKNSPEWMLEGLYRKERIEIKSEGFDTIWLKPN
jgi:hypothetical protein